MSSSFTAKLYIAFSLLLTSLFFWDGMYERYVVSRFFVLNILVIFALIFFAKEMRKDEKQGVILFDLAFLGYYIFNVVSIFQAINISEAVFAIQKVSLIFLAYLTYRWLLMRQKGQLLNAIVWTNALLSVCVLGVVLYQFTQIYTAVEFDNKHLYNISGASGNKSLLGEFLFLLLPFNFSGVIRFKKWRSLFTVLIGCLLILILYLQVRSALLALALAFLFFLVCGAFLTKNFAQVILKRVLPVGAIVLAGLLALAHFTGNLEGLLNRMNPLHFSQSDTANERYFYWYKTGMLIKQNSLTGVGAGNWKIEFPKNNLKGAWRLQEKSITVTRVHNDYLEIWSEIGLLGLLSYLSLFVMAFYYGIKALKSTKEKWTLLFLLSGLLGYCVIAFFDFPKERIEHQVYLALFFAGILYCSRTKIKWSVISFSKVTPILVGTTLFLCAFNFWICKDRITGGLHTLTMLNARIQKDWKTVVSEAQKAQGLWYNLEDSGIPLKWHEGIGKYQLNDVEGASVAFEMAYYQNPFNYQILGSYGASLVLQQEYDKAIPILIKCTEINPKHDEAKFNLAYSYIQKNQLEKAKEWVDKTTTSPDKKREFEAAIRGK